MEKEVAKMRSVISAQVVSINLLLGAHEIDALARIEIRSQKTHGMLSSHVRKSQEGLLNIQYDASTQAKLLSSLPDLSAGVANLSIQEQKVHHGLRDYACESLSSFENIKTRLQDQSALLSGIPALSRDMQTLSSANLEATNAQQLLLTSAREHRSGLDTIKTRMDTQASLLSNLPSLPSEMSILSNQVVDLRRHATQNAIAQAQCILQVKEEVQDMHRILQANSAQLHVLEATSATSSYASCTLLLTPKTIDVFLKGLRQTTRVLFRSLNAVAVTLCLFLAEILQLFPQLRGLLVALQRSLPWGPSRLLEDNILFEDALGRSYSLQFSQFCHWEVFEALLKTQFKEHPGKSSVARGEYHIIDRAGSGSQITKANWTVAVRPRSNIAILSQLNFSDENFPALKLSEPSPRHDRFKRTNKTRQNRLREASIGLHRSREGAKRQRPTEKPIVGPVWLRRHPRLVSSILDKEGEDLVSLLSSLKRVHIEVTTITPTKWTVVKDHYRPYITLSEDGLTATYRKRNHSDDASLDQPFVVTDYPMPSRDGLFYNEIKIIYRVTSSYNMIIGFRNCKAAPSNYTNAKELYGLNVSTGRLRGLLGHDMEAYSETMLAERIVENDVIGCGIDFQKRIAFFVKNGRYLGTAFHNVQPRLIPTVCFSSPIGTIRANFGQTSFVFDLSTYLDGSCDDFVHQTKKQFHAGDTIIPAFVRYDTTVYYAHRMPQINTGYAGISMSPIAQKEFTDGPRKPILDSQLQRRLSEQRVQSRGQSMNKQYNCKYCYHDGFSTEVALWRHVYHFHQHKSHMERFTIDAG
ncbi:MAG: hypothetical protein M1833_001655 [Piccolia ochrophora]|nr:MAG: hypothetical protein M1833_001655 [Piccolia ochrophora]